MMARNRRISGVKKPVKKSYGDGLLEAYFPIINGRAYRYRYESAEWPTKSTTVIRVMDVTSAGGKTTGVFEETNPDPDDIETMGVTRSGVKTTAVRAEPDPNDPDDEPIDPWVRAWKAERSAKGVWEGDRKWRSWVIRTPLRAGTTWESKAGTKFTIRSLKKTVKVPAGVFKNCLAISYEAEDIGTGELYYAKGVGLVRSIQRGEWLPYDYWLKSVKDGKVAQRARRKVAATAGGPRLMCFPAKKEAA